MEAISPSTNEINPQEIFETMKSDFYKINTNEILMINKEYIRKRRELINFNHKITKKLGFKSQTFFLSIYYLDIIFIKNKNLYIPNFFLLGLSCVIIAAKFCENDPNVPPLMNFINIYNRYNIHKIGMKELSKMEVKILKYLDYNIDFVTSYDFNLFFFNHGIIKKQQIKDIINNNTNLNKNKNLNNKSQISSNEEIDLIFDDSFYIKKILEKIYKKSRYYLDLIISNESICFKYDALLISICIMKKSIEEVILKEYKLKYKDYFLNKNQIIKKNNIYFKEIMTEFYKIKFDSLEKYNSFMKDTDVINIFQRKEREKEKGKEKLNIINQAPIIKENNLYNFAKVMKINNNTNIKSNENNNNFNTINTETIKNNNFCIKNKSVINLNNSMEHSKEKNGIKPNLTLFYNYNNNNTINYKYKDEKGNNSYAENIRNKLQMKNDQEKNLSLRKKRCNDKYFHINNLKSLHKLAFCANNAPYMEGGSLSKTKENNQYSQKKLLSNININSEDSNRGINNIYYIRSNSKENTHMLRTHCKLNNESLKKKKELKLENIDNNKIRYNKVIITDNFHSKEKNKSKYRNTITESKNLASNQKPYFKKVIHNYEPMNKKIINKNNIKINIFNILSTSNNINDMNELENKRNFLTIQNGTDNNYSQNKRNRIDLIKKRTDDIKKINKIRNMYNHKKLDLNIQNNKNIHINNQINTINNLKENRLINISPKSNSKSKEINYINIINETNNYIGNNENKISTLDNKSSYFKKKIFNSLNKNSNKYIINQNTIRSERQSEKLKKKLLLTNVKNKDNDNDIYNNNNDINELFKQKYNLQFHSKLFSILINNNK